MESARAVNAYACQSGATTSPLQGLLRTTRLGRTAAAPTRLPATTRPASRLAMATGISFCAPDMADATNALRPAFATSTGMWIQCIATARPCRVATAVMATARAALACASLDGQLTPHPGQLPVPCRASASLAPRAPETVSALATDDARTLPIRPFPRAASASAPHLAYGLVRSATSACPRPAFCPIRASQLSTAITARMPSGRSLTASPTTPARGARTCASAITVTVSLTLLPIIF